MLSKDWVMFVPACGEGTRVAERGLKPFVLIDKVVALDLVFSRTDWDISKEVALPAHMPLDSFPPIVNTVIYKLGKTRGQAHTIYEWMKRTRPRKYVIISNCDNWIDQESIAIGMDMVEQGRTDCMVFTFRPVDKKDKRFSYVSTRNTITEKYVSSDQACTGVYIATWEALEKYIWPSDEYLSASITRKGNFLTHEVEHYMGWGDMQQIEEIEKGIAQFTKE